MSESVKLYNANDGLTGRDGGPYLDVELAKSAEIQRAQVEGREPDFDTMSLGPGTRLVTASQLVQTQGITNIPSQSDNPAADKANAAAIDSLETVNAVAEIPAEAVEEPNPADLSAVSWLAGEYNAEETSAEEPVVEEEEF